MHITASTRGYWARPAQPVFAVLQRCLQTTERLPPRKHDSRNKHVASNAYTTISPTSRPGSPTPPEDIRMTSAQAVNHHSAEQMQEQQLFLAKAWNFLLGASGVFLFPYIPIFLQSHGLSSAQIGLLAALRPWLAAPVSMTASALADKHKIHVKLLLASAGLGALLRSTMPLAGGTAILMAMLLAGELIGAPTGVLGDATVLSNCKDPGDYGKQRQWGSIGFGVMSIPAGYIIQHTGITAAFLIYGLACIPLLIIGSKMRYNYASAAASISSSSISSMDSIPAARSKADAVQDGGVSNQGHAVAAKVQEPSGAKDLLMQPRVLLFLWRCLLAGFGFGVMANYEFLYLKGLGAPGTLMGIALLMSVCTEIPAFMFQGTILKHISAPTLLNIALAATAVRLAAYAALPGIGSTWAVLPVELLHGITFGIFFCTATVYSSKVAPPKLSATMQGMFQSTYGGIGAGLGGLIGGFLMDKLGGQGLFTISAAIVAAGGALGLLADQAIGRLQPGRAHKAMGHKAE